MLIKIKIFALSVSDMMYNCLLEIYLMKGIMRTYKAELKILKPLPTTLHICTKQLLQERIVRLYIVCPE